MAQAKIQAIAEWPNILNNSQEIVAGHVDGDGNGVFSILAIFTGTQYQRQVATISRYLQDMGILVRGRRTPTGAFNWHFKPRKVTVADVRKARARRKVIYGSKTKTKPKTKPADPDSSPSAKPKVSEEMPVVGVIEKLLEAVEKLRAENKNLRAENENLKARLKDLESHGLGEEIAERVSKLFRELNGKKS